MGSKVELFAAIRWDEKQLGLSIRELATKYGVHRRTVRQALACPIPPERKDPARSAPVRDSIAHLIDQILKADCLAPPKQRHTARRIWERLIDEHQVSVSYSYVAKYVHRRRGEINAEHARATRVVAGFVPQLHEPGKDAEVDFAECYVKLAGQVTKCFLFSFRLSCSGAGVHRVFASQGQEAFLEGHVIAFEAIGGVPTGQIRYDNLRSAVQRVLFGRNRTESARWTAFRSFYAFTAFYCIPGVEGAHEKGGVEGDGGRFRRTHLTPMPEVDCLQELNARLAEADRADLARHIEFRPRTVGEDLAAEQELLAALPGEPFDCALELSPRVDRYARITVRQCRYSVPAYLIGSRVRVRLSASHLEVYDGPHRVAVHARLIGRGGEHLVLDHYLDILKGKPGAMPGSQALATARSEGVFTSDHEAFWARARALHGEPAATKALIEVLLLHRRLSAAQVIAGIRAALAQGTVNPDLVAIEARKAAPPITATTGAAAPDAAGAHHASNDRPGRPGRLSPTGVLITLPARRAGTPAADLPADQRPAPSVRPYDQLLTRTRPATPPATPAATPPATPPASPTGTEER